MSRLKLKFPLLAFLLLNQKKKKQNPEGEFIQIYSFCSSQIQLNTDE